MNKIMLAIFGTVFLVVGLSSTSFAGEITGNGKWIKGDEHTLLNGKSSCAYSGREDEPDGDDDIFKGDLVQNWGAITKELRDFLAGIGLHPGDACNPKKSGGQEP